MTRFIALLLSAASLGMVAGGCMGEMQALEEQEPGLARVMSALPGQLLKVNVQPLPSLAAPGQQIDLWVSEPAQQRYQQIHPTESGSGIELPVGTAVVRAIRDASGQVTKYTALVKQAPGFNPPSDLWFAVFDPSGEPARDASGGPMQGAQGPMATCVGCHLTRAQDGYLFGVPRE